MTTYFRFLTSQIQLNLMNNIIPSALDFITSESLKLYRHTGLTFVDFSDHAEKLQKHAEFLNTKLHIRQYVPTLDTGEIFSDFQLDCLKNENNLIDLSNAYDKALSEIIFQNFEVILDSPNFVEIGLNSGHFTLVWDKRTKSFSSSTIETINDMVVYQLSTTLTF